MKTLYRKIMGYFLARYDEKNFVHYKKAEFITIFCMFFLFLHGASCYCCYAHA